MPGKMEMEITLGKLCFLFFYSLFSYMTTNSFSSAKFLFSLYSKLKTVCRPIKFFRQLDIRAKEKIHAALQRVLCTTLPLFTFYYSIKYPAFFFNLSFSFSFSLFFIYTSFLLHFSIQFPKSSSRGVA